MALSDVLRSQPAAATLYHMLDASRALLLVLGQREASCADCETPPWESRQRKSGGRIVVIPVLRN